jgi:hypothetical protein
LERLLWRRTNNPWETIIISYKYALKLEDNVRQSTSHKLLPSFNILKLSFSFHLTRLIRLKQRHTSNVFEFQHLKYQILTTSLILPSEYSIEHIQDARAIISQAAGSFPCCILSPWFGRVSKSYSCVSHISPTISQTKSKLGQLIPSKTWRSSY